MSGASDDVNVNVPLEGTLSKLGNVTIFVGAPPVSRRASVQCVLR